MGSKITSNEFGRPRFNKGTDSRLTDEKYKGSDTESRCHSARDRNREQKGKKERAARSRTRSVSPNFVSPCLPLDFPLKKLHNICSKIVIQLDLVKNLSKTKTSKNLSAENLLDLRRQLQRADEFAIRFSRNNLYDTKRLLNDIKNLSVLDIKSFCKKIILAYQTASQSLQIYINYIKNPGNVEVPDKLTELILLIAELFLRCAQYLPLPPEQTCIQNDAVKICNELLALLKSKPPVGEYLGLNQDNHTTKHPNKPAPTETQQSNSAKTLSMYRPTCPKSKPLQRTLSKNLIPSSSLLGNRHPKTFRKKQEKQARITHDIYTQKLNPKPSKTLASKSLKFDSTTRREAPERGQTVPPKKQAKKTRYFTPREVRSQDDDVETMVQTIDDDELPALALDDVRSETEEECEKTNFDKASFRELLLEAVDNLETSDKNNQKATLIRLLNSIQNCVTTQKPPTKPPTVKLFHFKHEENYQPDSQQQDEPEQLKMMPSEESKTVQQPTTGSPNAQRKLNIPFRLVHHTCVNPVAFTGKIPLNLDDSVMEKVSAYRKSFAEFTRDNLMYKKRSRTRPWELVEKVADRIIMDVIREVALDFENDAILKRLYLNELFEAVHL